MVSSQTLPHGYRLGSVEIGGAVKLGAVSVTYSASDDGRPVRVEEYYPIRFARRLDGVAVAPDANAASRFQHGLAAFATAGRQLARIRHEGIVPIRNCLIANGTCYVVTDLVDGETLAARLARGQTLLAEELSRILAPVIDGLAQAHRGGLLHRQINPGAITVRADGTALLTDFGLDAKVAGGARQTFGDARRQVSDLKAGYAALEQYSTSGREGAWTDVYGLAAVAYHCLTGRVPIDAPQRAIQDDLVPVSQAVPDTEAARTLAAIDAALQVAVAKRPQSVDHWRAMLLGGARTRSSENRAGRTSARGFGSVVPTDASVGTAGLPGTVSARGGGGSASTEAGRSPTGVRWMVPALTAVGLTAAMTWVDTDILRGGSPVPTSVPAFADALDEPGADALVDLLRSGGTGPLMVVVPSGARRIPCDGPCADAQAEWREVTLAERVAISKFEVTTLDYALFAAATDRPGAGVSDGNGRLPAVNVSWEDAVAYAAWLAAQTAAEYRLPTETEWEYAAAVDLGDVLPEPVGDRGGPAPAGSNRANVFGIHDLHHNVSEWVMDCADVEERPVCESRIRRGSSWIQDWPNAGAGARALSHAGYRGADTGFRVVRRLD